MNDTAETGVRTVRDWLLGDAAERLRAVTDTKRLRTIRVRAHRKVAGSSGEVSQHPPTSHYMLPGREASKPLCLKVFDVSHPDHAAFFRREVRMLRKLGRASKDGTIPLVPKVVLADGHSGIVVMEWVHGRSMKSELMWRYALQRDTSALLKDCGAWLRRFHQLNGIAEHPAPAIELMASMERQITTLQERSGPAALRPAAVLSALDLLRSEAPRLEGMPVEWSISHNDFTPSNLIRQVSSGAIMGIDFGYASQQSPVTGDLASFMMRVADLTAGSLTPRHKANENFLSLASGYKPGAGPDELRWLYWRVLYTTVARVLRREAAFARTPASVTGRMRRAIARRFAVRAVAQYNSLAEWK